MGVSDLVVVVVTAGCRRDAGAVPATIAAPAIPAAIQRVLRFIRSPRLGRLVRDRR